MCRFPLRLSGMSQEIPHLLSEMVEPEAPFQQPKQFAKTHLISQQSRNNQTSPPTQPPKESLPSKKTPTPRIPRAASSENRRNRAPQTTKFPPHQIPTYSLQANLHPAAPPSTHATQLTTERCISGGGRKDPGARVSWCGVTFSHHVTDEAYRCRFGNRLATRYLSRDVTRFEKSLLFRRGCEEMLGGGGSRRVRR